jgi:hypothetical protein
MKIGGLRILIVLGLTASAVGLGGCGLNKEKGYYELQREALNPDENHSSHSSCSGFGDPWPMELLGAGLDSWIN